MSRGVIKVVRYFIFIYDENMTEDRELKVQKGGEKSTGVEAPKPERRLKEEHFDRINQLTVGREQEDRDRVLNLLGGQDLAQNKNLEALEEMCILLEEGKDIEAQLKKLKPQQKAQLQAMLYLTGAEEVLSEEFGAKTAFSIYRLFAKDNQRSNVQTIKKEVALLEQVSDVFRGDEDRGVEAIKKRTAAIFSQLNEETFDGNNKAIYQAFDKMSKIMLVDEGRQEQVNESEIYWKCFSLDQLPAAYASEDEIKDLIDHCGEDPVMLAKMAQELSDIDKLADFAALLDQKLLVHALNEGEGVSDIVLKSSLSDRELITDSLMAIVQHWDEFTDPEQQALVLSSLAQTDRYNKFICQAVEAGIKLPDGFLERYQSLNPYEKGKVFIAALSSSSVKELGVEEGLPDFLKQDLQDGKFKPSSLYSRALLASLETGVELPATLIAQALQDQQVRGETVCSLLLDGGLELFNAVPEEVREQLIAEPYSSKQSREIVDALLRKKELYACSQELMNVLQVDADMVLGWFGQSVKEEIPQGLKEKAGAVKLTERNKADLLQRAVFRGSLQVLVDYGGQELLNQCLDLKKLGSANASDLLRTALHVGWQTTPPEVRRILTENKWDVLDSAFLQTKDIQAIATMVQKSGFTINEAEKSLDFTDPEVEKLKALFIGCSEQDVNRVLASVDFQKHYPEFYQLAQSTVSLGERALIVRTAYQGMDGARVQKLLDQARVQPNARFKTSSMLTELHTQGIYWENWEDVDRSKLTSVEGIKDYFDENPSKLTADQLVSFIGGNSDPSNTESVFYLIDNAKNILEEGEELNNKHYQELCWAMLGRKGASDEILTRLSMMAGWTTSEDFTRLLEREMSGCPFAERIENITRMGNIDHGDFKRISWQYLDSEVYLSTEAFKVMFDYLKDDSEHAYTQEEKARCWQRLRERRRVQDFTKQDLNFFEQEGVLSISDFRSFALEWFKAGPGSYGNTGEMVAHLLEKAVPPNQPDSHDLSLTYLQNYVSKDGSYPDSSVIRDLKEYTVSNWGSSSRLKAGLEAYFQRGDINVNYITSFLAVAEDQMDETVIHDGVLRAVEVNKSIPDRLAERFADFGVSQSEYRQMLKLALDQRGAAAVPAFKILVEGAVFTPEEVRGKVKEFLESTESSVSTAYFSIFVEKLEYQEVEDLFYAYHVDQQQIISSHTAILEKILKSDETAYVGLWERIKEAKPAYRFFDADRLDPFTPSEQLREKGYILVGSERVEELEPLALQDEARVFYRHHLAYSENKGWLEEDKVREILGAELYQKLTGLKIKVRDEVLEQGSVPWMLNREKTISHKVMIVHGTGQANTRTSGVTRSEEDALGAQETVRVIVDKIGGDVGIRGEKTYVGSFFLFTTENGYGRPDDGCAVIIFTDSLLQDKAGISISENPLAAGTGFVTRDGTTGRYVAIPNRHLFNPQAGEILGQELTSAQMTSYLMQLNFELSQDPEFLKAIEDAGLTYERERLADEFLEDITAVHTKMRQMDYPEGAILWVRDYYAGLALSEDLEDQKQFACLRKIVKAVGRGEIGEDVRSLFDNVRIAWDLGLKDDYSPFLTAKQVVRRAEQVVLKNQRTAYVNAMRSLRSEGGEYIGVARQLKSQVAGAEAVGDIPKLEFGEVLQMTKGVFFDSDSLEDYQRDLDQVEKLAGYITEVKRSVLRTTFDRSLSALPKEKMAVYQKYQSRIAVCDSGSGGRGESIISSDLDYLVLVDDVGLSEENLEELRDVLADVGKEINKILESEYFIRPDAGLANKDRQPVVLLSKLKELNIKPGAHRQEIDPTEMLDANCVQRGQEHLVSEFRQAFLERNSQLEFEEAPEFEDYIDGVVDNFVKQYNGGLSQFLSSDQLVDFKVQMQRIYNFKVHSLLADAFPKIQQQQLDIPSSTMGKIDILQQTGIISNQEAASLKELGLTFYRMRYRSDVINSAQLAQRQEISGDVRAKIIAKFDPRTLTAQERTRMLVLLNDFNQLTVRTAKAKEELQVKAA